MQLSSEVQAKLLEIRTLFIKSIEKRSAHPYDFNENIACLKDVETYIAFGKELAIPYLQKIDELMLGLEKALDQISLSITYKYEITLNKNFVKELNNILFDKEIQALLKKEFSNSLISGLSFDQGFKEKTETISTYNKDPRFFGQSRTVSTHEQTKLKTYRIQFLDNSTITLHNLEDEHALKNAETAFNDKMKELRAADSAIKQAVGF